MIIINCRGQRMHVRHRNRRPKTFELKDAAHVLFSQWSESVITPPVF